MPELLTLEEYLKGKQQRSQKPSFASKEYLKKKGKDISGERLTEKEYLSKKQVRKKPEREPRKIIWRPFAEKLKPLAEKIRRGITKQKPFDKGEFKSIWGFEPIQDIKPPEKPTAMTMLTKTVGVGGGRPEIREPYPKTLTDRIKEVISKPFVRTKGEEIARSQNIYAISKELDLPLTTVRKNYSQLVNTLGLRDYPTTGELMGGMLIMPITAGLMTHPVTTVIGISGFMGLSEIESAVISKIKGEPYKFLHHKGLKDLLPEEVNQYTSDTVEVLDFIGKGLILGGIKMKAPRIAEKFTKNIITEYKMPKRVYISARKVSSIFKTGKEISPQELELIKDLGLSGKQYRNATMKGIAIEIPAEKIVTIADKPYFSRIKHLFRLKPYKEIRTFRAGKPTEVIPEERLLPAPTKVPEPVTKVAKPEISNLSKLSATAEEGLRILRSLSVGDKIYDRKGRLHCIVEEIKEDRVGVFIYNEEGKQVGYDYFFFNNPKEFAGQFQFLGKVERAVPTLPPVTPPTEVISKEEALAKIKRVMPRIKELSTHITASKSIGREIEPETYTELERLNDRISELMPVAYPKEPKVIKPPVAVPTTKGKIPEVVTISGLAKAKSHIETQLDRKLIEKEKESIDILGEGEDYVINDKLIITHKTGTLAAFEIRDVDTVREATAAFLAKERKEALKTTGEITFYQAVRSLGGVAPYRKGMPGGLAEEYNTIVPIHCRRGALKGGRPLDELANAFSKEYPQFGIENEKELLEAFKNEKMARMNRVSEVYGRPIADKAKKFIFGEKSIEAVQKTLFGPEEKVPIKPTPAKAVPGQPELPFGAKPKFEVLGAKPIEAKPGVRETLVSATKMKIIAPQTKQEADIEAQIIKNIQTGKDSSDIPIEVKWDTEVGQYVATTEEGMRRLSVYRRLRKEEIFVKLIGQTYEEKIEGIKKPEVPTRVPLNIITEEQATVELNQRKAGLKFPDETEQEAKGRINALEFYAKPTAEEIELPPRIEKPGVIKTEEVKPGAPRGWKLIQDTQLLKRYKTEEGTLEIDIAQTLSKDGLRKFIFKIKKIGRKTEIRARNLEKAIEKYKLKTGAVEVYEGEELRILKGYEINRVLEDLEMTAGMEASDNWIKSSIESVVGTLSEKEMSSAIKDIKEAIKSTPPEVYTFPKVPRPTPEVTPTEKIDKVKRSEIVKYISEKLGVPIRIGRFRERAWGIYKRTPKIARIKAPTDVATAAHEIGHYIYEELKPLAKTKIDPSLVPKYAEELASFLIDFPELKRTPREAFSEFINAYITDPIRAKKVAPTLYAYFENFISNYPKIQMVLNTAQQDYQRWLKLPATAKILSHISPTPEKTSVTTLGRLYALAIDELFPLKKYVDIIKKKGTKVFEEDDPFILATAHRGWHGKADAFLRHKTFDINYNWTGKSLQDIYKPIGEAKALDDFDAYLVSKHAIEVEKYGKKTGIKPQDARKAIRELTKKYPFFKEKAEELYQYQNRLFKYALDSELITPEFYNTCTKKYNFYVPFYRVVEIAGRKGLLGRGVVNLPNIFKGLKGSEREIIRPSESIVKNTYTIIDAAERNQIATALVKLAEMYPKDLGRLVEKIPPIMVKLAGISLKEIGIDADPEVAEQIIDIFRPSILNPSENIIRVMRKGKKSYYQVDPDLYKSLAATDRESVNMLIKILSYPARWLRLGAVALSPEFVVRNPVRDAFTAFCYSKGGFIPGLDTLRGVASILGQDELYWKWKISGAEHSALVSLDRKYLQKNIRDLISTQSKKLLNVIKEPVEHARILAEIGEEATRIGEYRLVLGGGKRWFLAAEKVPEGLPLKSRMLRAGIAARQVTLDFSRLGAKTKAVNSIIAFWNANVQDLDKIARSFKDNPIRTLYKVLVGITIPSILLWLHNKDDERYKEIPQWQKDLFWIIIPSEKAKKREREMLPKGKRLPERPIWRIPKPFTLGILFGTIPERMLDYIYNEDPEAFKGLFKTVGRAINPGIIPTALLAPTEAITNYSFFLDRPIEPMGTQKLFPEQRYTQYTTETAKLLGKTLKISPSKIEYFLRGYWGALGKMGLETLDLILRSAKLVPKPKGPTPTLADIPLVRGFVVREPVGSVSEALNEFYELSEKSQMAEATIKDLIKKRDKKLVNKYKTHYPEYRVAMDCRAVGKRLSDLRKRRIEIWESDKLTRERKREKILEIERTMTRIARRLLNRYRELTKKEKK